tara:strand:+ start:2680 stop:3942 length:1263 start_codon:yes stop_codon:yes gene_type:complete
MKFKHLDLFSGIGGFHLGFKKAGFEIESYYSEIDKYAIDVYKNNFNNSTYVGSVTDVRGGELPGIDIITFGSPCQDFSLAGKRKGLGGERSSLISEAIRLIKECRPRFFIWENVKGTFSSNSGEDFWSIIQTFANIGGYRLEWQLLNTKWFLPQNRERIYLVGCLGNGSGKQIFPIGENNYKINELQGQQANTCTLTTRYNDAKGNGSYIVERKPNAQEKIEVGTWRTHKDGQGFRKILDNDCPSIAARAREDGSGQPVIKVTSKKNDKLIIGYSRDSKGKVIKRNLKLQANTLHSSSGSGNNTDQYIYDGYNNKVTHNCLTEAIGRQGSSSEYITSLNKINLSTGLIRRLTPIECERLQGFPDDWTKIGLEKGEISDSQRYKMCGNAVTVDVVEAVANKIKEKIKINNYATTKTKIIRK